MSSWGHAIAVGWTGDYHFAARAEGWNLFLADSSMWRVEKDDALDVLPADFLAWAIVMTHDSPHHRAAREIVRRHNPKEWVHWCRTVSKMKLDPPILPELIPEIIATLLTC